MKYFTSYYQMRVLTLLHILITSLMLSSCSKDTATPNTDPRPLELWSNVKVIDSVVLNLDSARSSLTDGKFIYKRMKGGSTPNVGDVIVGATGSGYLRRVTAKVEDSSTLALTTEQAVMSEVFRSGDIKISDDLSGLSEARKQSLNFSVSNIPVLKNSNVDINLDQADIFFDPQWNFDLRFGEGGLEYFEMGTKGASWLAKAQITAKGLLPLTTSRADTLRRFEKYLRKWVMVGAVPVPIIMRIKLFLVAESSVAFTRKFTSEYAVNSGGTIDLGLKYDNGNWLTDYQFNPATNIQVKNNQDDNAYELNFGLRPVIAVEFYGLAGPAASIGVKTRGVAQFLNSPPNWWDLRADGWLNPKLEINARILDKKYLMFTKEWETRRLSYERPDTFYVASGDNQTAAKNQRLPNPIEVKVLDSRKSPVKYVPVEFGVTGGTGSVDSTYSWTDANGIAKTRWTLGPEKNQTLEAKVKKGDGGNLIGQGVIEIKAQTDSANCDNLLSFTDPRDGQVYKIVTIGTQTWMAQNLNYATGNSWCYDNNTANCATYGRLYDWQTAKGACPAGWHLPTDAEWAILTTFLGGTAAAGGKMKSVTGWNAPNTGATNQSCFSALPGGYRVNISGFFASTGIFGNWWSATEDSTDVAWFRYLYHVNEVIHRDLNNKGNGLSVRCLRD